MILGFMKRFPDKTETGFKDKIEQALFNNIFGKGGINQFVPKLHTIRTDSKKRWKAGMKIHFCTGVRTKQMNNFAMGVCKSVQEVKIILLNNNRFEIYIDEKLLNNGDSYNLAINDGFNETNEFVDYFRFEAKMEGDYPVYRGRLIHWTDLKY